MAIQSVRAGARIEIPSRNGATLALRPSAAAVFTACLRNCRAVAGVARVIPAGERWPDGSVRPALEDLIGAGAVLAELPGRRRC